MRVEEVEEERVVRERITNVRFTSTRELLIFSLYSAISIIIFKKLMSKCIYTGARTFPKYEWYKT